MDNIHDATRRGDVESLRRILAADPTLSLAHKKFTSFLRTPLHIAAMLGYIKFAREILKMDPRLALMEDSQGFTPLHLASTRNNIEMVRLLIQIGPGACLVQDRDGRTPLHLAAMKNEVKVMKLLFCKCPKAIHRVLPDTNETILHLCVKNNKFRALKMLVECLETDRENPANNPDDISVNSIDIDGNTILHLAAEPPQMKMLKYLLGSSATGVDISIRNTRNRRALDMLKKNEIDDLEFFCDDYHVTGETIPQQITTSDKNEWLKERLNTIMVVATLIAGIAFQAVNHPPGGIFLEDTKIDSTMDPVMFAYYLKQVVGTPMSRGFQAYINNLPPQLKTSINITADEILTYRANFVKNLLMASTTGDSENTPVSPYMSHKLAPGIVLEDDWWMSIVSDFNTTYGGGSGFSPYVIRYAGTAILAYTSPNAYEVYIILNTLSLAVSILTILTVTFDAIDERRSTTPVRFLELLVAIAVGCTGLSYTIVLSTISPPFYAHNTLYRKFVVAFFGVIIMAPIASFIYTFIFRLVRDAYMKGLHRFRLQQYALNLPLLRRFIFGGYPRTIIINKYVRFCVKFSLFTGALIGLWAYISTK